MKQGVIIARFATCGKSVLGRKYKNVIDLESSNYKHINDLENVPVEMRKGTKREINQEWPENYYRAINDAINKYDVVFVQLKPEQQAKIATRMNISAGWTSWGTITAAQATSMNLTSLE